MDDLPEGFVADLRQLGRWPELVDTLWRSPQLVELTYGRLWRLVADALPAAPARILDVGSGTGVVSLEMARAGHDVTAVDPDPASIALARRSAERGGTGDGRLAYHEGEIGSWEPAGGDSGPGGSFDAVVTTRVLHHVPDPAGALGRIRRWLRPGGRLVCVDFLHDRFDRRAARWTAQVRGLLEAAGRFHGDAPLPADPSAATERVEWEWEQEHVVEHELNDSPAIEEPLARLFPGERRSWHPYLYWDLLVGLDPGDRDDGALAELIAAWEAAALAAGDLPAVLFRSVATRF
jgi:SAM-dependent methyltransferase